jgi:CDGSH-type Zn-finger protein
MLDSDNYNLKISDFKKARHICTCGLSENLPFCDGKV